MITHIVAMTIQPHFESFPCIFNFIHFVVKIYLFFVSLTRSEQHRERFFLYIFSLIILFLYIISLCLQISTYHLQISTYGNLSAHNTIIKIVIIQIFIEHYESASLFFQKIIQWVFTGNVFHQNLVNKSRKSIINPIFSINTH